MIPIGRTIRTTIKQISRFLRGDDLSCIFLMASFSQNLKSLSPGQLVGLRENRANDLQVNHNSIS